MSKNTRNAAYRKVDVDRYAEDQFEEENLGEEPEGPNEGEVSSLLLAKKCKEALVHVLDNAPIGSKNTQVRDRALALTLRVLTSFKSTEIEGIVKSLSPQQVDVLMKYVYAGFAQPSDDHSKLLLTWHEKTFEVGGLGSIVRVLTDRKRVA